MLLLGQFYIQLKNILFVTRILWCAVTTVMRFYLMYYNLTMYYYSRQAKVLKTGRQHSYNFYHLDHQHDMILRKLFHNIFNAFPLQQQKIH